MDNNTTSAPVEQKKSFDFLVANGINVQSGIDILGDSETYDSMLKEFHNLNFNFSFSFNSRHSLGPTHCNKL